MNRLTRNRIMLAVGSLIMLSLLIRATPVPQQMSGATHTIVDSGSVGLNTSANTVKIDAANNTVVLGAGAANVGNVGLNPAANTVKLDPANNAVTFGSSAKMQTVPVNACGVTNFETAWTAVPTTTTVISSVNMCLYSIIVQCPTGNTVTVTDNSGTPIQIVPPAFSYSSAGFIGFLFDYRQTNGVKASANATGCFISLKGVQSP
jgi:hypothetical protein